MWDAAKAGLRRKFTAMQAYLKKIEHYQVNNLILHLKQLKKNNNKKKKKSKLIVGKKILKIRAKINEKVMKETIAKINKSKSWFFESINKIDKPP